jgi:hypothetical protein
LTTKATDVPRIGNIVASISAAAKSELNSSEIEPSFNPPFLLRNVAPIAVSSCSSAERSSVTERTWSDRSTEFIVTDASVKTKVAIINILFFYLPKE